LERIYHLHRPFAYASPYHLSLHILINPPSGRQFIIKQLSNTIIAPNVRPRGGASTAGNTPIDKGIETPGLEPLSMTLPEKIEAARRRIAELEEQERIRIELETIEAQIR
jgi:hypothetical protein